MSIIEESDEKVQNDKDRKVWLEREHLAQNVFRSKLEKKHKDLIRAQRKKVSNL